ncbi:MAG: type II secretion system F family protein [Candidatus Accumulibacter sp. UW26]|jgi:general secretion pathway protein F
MPDYLVRVHEPGRGVAVRRVSAPDPQSLAAVLGVAATRVLSAEPVAAASVFARPVAARRVAFPLRLFSQELAVLLDAGIPLLEALETLCEKESEARVAAVIGALITGLRDGQPLSATLVAQPAAFDTLFCAIIAASERSGQIAAALRQHARYLGWVDELRARIASATIYPLLLLAVGGAVVMFLLLFVLPRFAAVFEGQGRDLPWASLALMAFGRFAGEHRLAVLAPAAALPLALFAAWRRSALRNGFAGLLGRSPWIGPRLRVLALARCYRTLAMLLAAGVPAAAALHLAGAVIAAPFRPALAAATQRVEEGVRLSDALEAQGLATPVARRMLRVGERSGELAAMLEQTAAFHDEEIARFTDFITRALNPTLMLIMGVVIGGIIVLMYLPIFELVEQVH